MKMLSVIGLIGGAALLTAAPVSLHRSQNTVALSFDSADARIGRPRTALSVAGVQQRGYRRAYRGAVYGGVAGYGAGSYYSGYSSPAYSAPYYDYWIPWLRLSELLRTVLRVWLWVVLRRLWILHRTPLQPGDFSASGVALLRAPGRPAGFTVRRRRGAPMAAIASKLLGERRQADEPETENAAASASSALHAPVSDVEAR